MLTLFGFVGDEKLLSLVEEVGTMEFHGQTQLTVQRPQDEFRKEAINVILVGPKGTTGDEDRPDTSSLPFVAAVGGSLSAG